MTEQELRALVREALARHVGAGPSGVGASPNAVGARAQHVGANPNGVGASSSVGPGLT